MSKKDAIATVDREVPDVIEDLQNQGSWATAMVDPVAELAKFEAAAELQSKLVPASIKRTLPEDWIDQGGKAYLQSTGVERLTGLWGLLFGEPKVDRVNQPDGSFEYVVTGPIGCRRTGVVYKAVTGGRSSADPFFDEFDEDKPKGWRDMTPGERAIWKKKHRIEPSDLDVRKAAITNWSTRGASMLMGMRGFTTPYLETLGVRGIRRVEYGAGVRGGDAAPADVKARRTALWNDLVRRTAGDIPLAKDLLRDVTKYDAYKNKKTGKDVAAFAGATSVDNLSEYALQVAEKKAREHPVFGDAALAKGEPAGREPGDEEEGA